MKKRIHIAICDDESRELGYIQALVEKWADENGYSIDISTFGSAEAFWFAYAVNKKYDVLLLDIEMKEMNGVALAKRIREENRQMQIVFITGFPDYMQQGYDVAALHYLLKPVGPDKLSEVLSRAVAKLDYAPRIILLEAEDETLRVDADDILYVEALSHHMEVTLGPATHGKAERELVRCVMLRQSITKLHEQLGKGFIRCHRSYLVNLARVERVTKTDVILDNGQSVPLSRRMYAQVNQQFIAYYIGQEENETI